MDADEKFEIITRNLQEVVDEDRLNEVLKTRDLKVYWGTAPTGRPHLGYFVPMMKIADLLKAGCHVTILFANIHAYLDSMKSSWELLDKRTNYYEFLIKEMLTLVGVPLEKLKFVKGTEFQLQDKYTLDMYKMSALASTRDTKKAGADVVKQSETPKMSGLLYPILQALDEVYLDVDAQFGGVDQRKIFMFAREFLPKIGYEKRVHLMNFLIPGLGQSGKMSSSEPNSKVDFDDDDDTIKRKLKKAHSVDGEVEGNGVLAILKFIIYPKLKNEDRKFIVDRPEQYGGKVEFDDFEKVEYAFSQKELSSFDLKMAVADEIIKLISPLRNAISKNEKLYKESYPEE